LNHPWPCPLGKPIHLLTTINLTTTPIDLRPNRLICFSAQSINST